MFNNPNKSNTGLNIGSICMKLTAFFLWVFAAWMILWNLLRIWPGEQLWVIAMVNYFAPWFALLLLMAIIIAMLMKERLLSGSVVLM